MAGDLNRVWLIGRLTRDPELRQITSGTSLCRFSVANNRIYTQNGERREEVSFFNCVAWGRLAEIVQQYCQKGKQVALEGRLRQNTWQDNEGKKNSTVEVTVDQLQMLGTSQGGSSFTSDASNSTPPPSPRDDSSASNGTSGTEGNPVKDTHTNQEQVTAGNMDDDDIPF